MLVVGIAGDPGIGKTTLVRELMGNPSGWEQRKQGLVLYHIQESTRRLIVGRYEAGQTFGGTDRLSMAAAPAALSYLAAFAKVCPRWRILFEGDRLMSASFIRSVSEITKNAHWFALRASEATLAERRAGRGSNQNATWLKGRSRKVANLIESRDIDVIPLPYDTPAECVAAKQRIGRLFACEDVA